MTTVTEKTALEGFAQGKECSQQICACFAAQVDPTGVLYKAAAAFGGGLGHIEQCGCLAGALLVLGATYAPSPGDSPLEIPQKRELLRQKKEQFETMFRERHGTLLCRELLHYDLAHSEKAAVAVKSGVFASVCAPLVCSTIQELKELLQHGGMD